MSLSRAGGWALVADQDQRLLAPFYEAQLALVDGAPIGAHLRTRRQLVCDKTRRAAKHRENRP
jgi:hypothetical protein